jgi:DNA-binding transcriptional ArsR family regulator
MATAKSKRSEEGRKIALSRRPSKAPRLREARHAAELFKQVSDPTRLQVLMLLQERERSVAELCVDLGSQSQPAVSHHLALLRHSRLIEPRRLGQYNVYSLTESGNQVAIMVRDLVSSRPTPIDPELLKDVGGFVDDAEAWFRTPNPELEGRKPIDLIGTAEERRLRYRIEAAKFGMFS